MAGERGSDAMQAPTQLSLEPLGRAHLVVVTGRDIGRRYEVGPTTLIGRGDRADFRLDDEIISRLHARIAKKHDGYVIDDLESRNGVFVNGEQVTTHRLSFGDRIGVGSTVMLFVEHDSMQEQLHQQQKLQALGELASGVAHDFNNLIGAILASVTHMQELGIDHGELSHGLHNVETAARRAADFTQRLLTFGSARQRAYRPVSLEKVVDETGKLLRGTVSRDIELHTSCDPNLAVVGDETRLIQAVLNLCINAQDAMPNGGRLAISTRRVQHRADAAEDDSVMAPSGYVELSVSDTGTGIEEKHLEEIFRPFFTTKERGEGTGLGLATVHAVVKAHGGSIQARSRVGFGTTFLLYLPAADPKTEALASVDQTIPPTARALRGTALVVEDESVVLRGVKLVLERSGMKVVSSTDGGEGLELFQKHGSAIDVVLLDLDMPVMNGADLLSRIREIDRRVPVVITTGHVTEERELALRNAGASGFLHKPYDASGLRQAVSAALFARRTPHPKDALG